MGRLNDFQKLNRIKASFDEIYTAPDPRDYFRVLGALDYVIPDLAAPVFRQLARAFEAARGQAPRLLDIGCSYGVNAALIRLPLGWDILRDRYARPAVMALEPEELAARDRAYFEAWPPETPVSVMGLDVSAPAVGYAQRAGLLEAGVAADLEHEACILTAEQERALASADMFISTGCVGYVTERTFERLLSLRPPGAPKPWVASFVLRLFPYEGIAERFARHGLATEKLGSCAFVQRRFRDADEFENTLARLERLGLDPTGLESEGLFYAELFLSRPEEEARAAPLQDIVTVASGRSRRYGSRFTRLETAEGEVVTVTR